MKISLKTYADCNAQKKKFVDGSMLLTKRGDAENEKANKNEFAGF